MNQALLIEMLLVALADADALELERLAKLAEGGGHPEVAARLRQLVETRPLPPV